MDLSLSIGEWVLENSGIRNDGQYSIFTITFLILLVISIRYYMSLISFYNGSHSSYMNSKSHCINTHNYNTHYQSSSTILSIIGFITSFFKSSTLSYTNTTTTTITNTTSTTSRPLSPSLSSSSSSYPPSSPPRNAVSTSTTLLASSSSPLGPSISPNRQHDQNKPYILGSLNGTIGTVGDKFSFVVVTQPQLFKSINSDDVNSRDKTPLTTLSKGQLYNHLKSRSSIDVVSVNIYGQDIHNVEERAHINVVDKRNGTFNIHFTVTKSGYYEINIFVNQVLLPPVVVFVAPVQYLFSLSNVESNRQNMVVAGEEFTFEITPTKTINQKINDQLEIDTFLSCDNGAMKKIGNDFTLYTSTDPEGYHGRGKLGRSGDYVIEGSVQGILVFSKSVKVEPSSVSSKYTQVIWYGKELISENKFFILEDSTIATNQDSNINHSSLNNNNILKFLIVTKDQYGNLCNGDKDIRLFSVEATRSFSPFSNKTFNNQKQCFTTSLESYTITKDEQQFENGLIVTIPIEQCGWHQINILFNGIPLSNSPFSLIAINQPEYSHLSNRYNQGISSFPCQIEKSKKLANVMLNFTSTKIEITENYYVANLMVYEFIINPTIQIQIINENQLLIKDNKTKIVIHNCSNTFLILLTAYYFFGDQTEPSFDSKCKWLKEKLNKIQSNDRLKSTPLKLNISSRDNILEESLDILKSVTGKNLLTTRIIVKFENEEGVDVGGISKEWFSKFSEGMGIPMKNGYRLFECRANNRYQPSPFSNFIPDYKSLFKTMGRIAAKSIVESVLKADRHLSIHFTPSFYKILLNENITIDDIESLDPVLYRNLFQYILNNPMDHVNQVLGDPLYFVHHIYDNEMGGNEPSSQNTIQGKQQSKVVNLKPFGNLIRVTDENKEEYLTLLAESMLSGSFKSQIEEFKEGFYQLLPQEFISIFTWKELETLMCGKGEVNVDDLKAHCNITGFVSEEIINHFWNILNEFGEDEKKSLLRFVTGSSSVPLGGFYQLYPHFTINITPNTSVGRLPVSHTCFNRIDIPRGLTSYQTLKQNILTAISEASEGFSLV